MEKRIHLYVRRKHPCPWLMVLCMVASVALRIVCYNGSLWIGTSAFIGEVNWVAVGSTAALAGVLSLLTSVAGLPELKN